MNENFAKYFSVQKIYSQYFEDFSYCLIYHMKDSHKAIIDEFQLFPSNEEFEEAIQKFVSENPNLFKENQKC